MKDTALLLIDIQKGLDDLAFYGGNRNNLDAEKNASIILKRFRELGYSVFHVQHSSQNPASPLHPSKPGFEIKDEVKPLGDEPIFIKTVNSAFIGTYLEAQLKENKFEHLVMAGLTTQHCISSSVRMAANLGFKVTLIADACAAFDQIGIDGLKIDAEIVHNVTLSNLKDEFAEIVDTSELLKVLNSFN